MCETKNYAALLEKKLIDEFRQRFEEKIGYKPIVLTRITADGSINIPLMSLDQLESYFEPYLPNTYNRPVTISTKSRKRELVELRMIFCAIARMMKFTHSSIGLHLGNRNHTTIIHNIATFANLIETHEAFRQKYFLILNHIKDSNESSTMDQFDQTQRQPQLAVLP
jgi:hypothetical protein